MFCVAVACRVAVIVRDGGLHGATGYDAGVYFAAGDALAHGRLPYRDFVFLHPPALIVALTPFGWLTRLVSDPTAFMVANLSMTVVGGACAVLVLRICRRLRLGRSAALVGGLFYATWFGAVGAEYHVKLEPVGNLVLLAAVLLALTARRTDTRGRTLAAGALLGVALSVKIWWVVPVLGVILWYGVATRRARDVALLAAGAAGSAVAICFPFFALAPRQMWESVIVDQLARHRRMNPVPRIADLSTLRRLGAHLPHGALTVGCLLAGGLLLVVIVRAWRAHAARPAVLLLAAQLLVLFVAPSWFPYYTDYVAGALSVTVAAAARTTWSRRRLPPSMARWLPTGAVATVTLAVLVTGSAAVQPLPAAATLTRAVADTRCVMSDSAMGLIEVNALSRGLAQGCPNWIDVTGRTYQRDLASPLPRPDNRRWQADLTRYLRSGDAVIIVRRAGTGISRQTQAAISRDGVLARADGQTIYRVTHARTGTDARR